MQSIRLDPSIVNFDFVSSKSHALTGNKIINDIDANQLLRIPREGGGDINVPKKTAAIFFLTWRLTAHAELLYPTKVIVSD